MTHSDSDRHPEGRDLGLGAEHESTGPKDIAQTQSGSSS